MGVLAVFRFLIVLLFAGFFGIAGLLFFAITGMNEENEELRTTEKKLSNQIEKLSRERDYKREYYHRLLYDEKFAERIIRQKLGFSNPDEIVFRFEESAPVRVSDPFSPKPNAPVAAGNVPAGNLPAGNISAGNADAAATAETSQTFAEKTLGGAGQDSNQLGQANAQDAPAIPKEKSLVDYLMFWRANGKSKNSSAPDAAEALTAAELPEIAAPGESNAKKDGAPDAAEEPENAVAAARAEEAAGELKTISNPPRDRIKFLTQSTSRLKAKAAPPPQPIIFSNH